MSSASEPDPRAGNAQTFFQYGNEAALKNNFDYAIDMYRRACKLQPGNLLFRQSLRGIQRRKFDNDPHKVGNFVGTKTQPIKLRARSLKGKGQWEQILHDLEEAFNYSPWDVHASMDAAEAAEKLGFGDVSMWLLESVMQQGHDDVKFMRYTAKIYELNKCWHKAISCWERVRKVNPYDEDAIRQINSLAANETIARSGLGESLANDPNAGRIDLPPGAEELKIQAMSTEDRLIREIKDEPTFVRHYLELADLYKKKQKLEEAEKVLDKARKAFPDDNLIVSEHAEVQMSRLRQAIDSWSKRVQKLPDDEEAPIKLEKLKSMLANYEIKEFRRRLDLRPDDPKLHFDLGLRFRQADRNDEAIAEFQQARNSPELKVQAMYQAGLAFEANGVLKLAERSYQDALKSVAADDHAILNALHYQLGTVAEAQGNHVAAEEHYNEVASNDYSYKDVARRLRALNQRPPE